MARGERHGDPPGAHRSHYLQMSHANVDGASFECIESRRSIAADAVGWPSRPEGRLGPEGTRGCTIRVPEGTALRLRESVFCERSCPHGAASCRSRDPAALSGAAGPPLSICLPKLKGAPPTFA